MSFGTWGFKSPFAHTERFYESHGLDRGRDFRVWWAERRSADDVEPGAKVEDKTARLQADVNRLAAMLNARPIEVGVVLKNDDRNIYIDHDGWYHYDYRERGRQKSAHSWRRMSPRWCCISCAVCTATQRNDRGPVSG
ncbi:hypothetical protein BST30_12210 [Mycobacterium mantenii]|uniref:Uncharacterized protein n=1 Tax=Mycobacterium mantenii TaxID=560555 RepID=A0A1X0FW23_MYCNT|nr:hypothetical protein BST30_12210 [Mycobacterium mantenii]